MDARSSTFDFDKYKRQCSRVAQAYQDCQRGQLTDAAYEAIVSQADMLTQAVVWKIEREIITKGRKFRPVDAYQF